MKKALLVLVGGRPMPNMLTIIHERPEVVAAIVSQDEPQRMGELQRAIEKFSLLSGYKPTIVSSAVVDAYQLEDIRGKCVEAVEQYPECEWIFNVTAATKIMGIGAYEVARELVARGQDIRCWYLDTQHTQVVPLVGQGRDGGIFRISMNEYAAACDCVIGVKDQLFADEQKRKYCQDNWVPFAQFLGKNTSYIDAVKELVRTFSQIKGADLKRYPLKKAGDDTYRLLELAEQVHLIEELDKERASFTMREDQARFLEGAWLELYVWSEAQQLQQFDHCEWNQKLVVGNRPKEKDPDNELDVMLLYNTNLIVAECKTGQKSFEPYFLSHLASAVRPLGDNAVTKLFVTSSSGPSKNAFSATQDEDKNKRASYDKFVEKAEDKRILVLTREDLPNLGQKIKDQIKKPKHARI